MSTNIDSNAATPGHARAAVEPETGLREPRAPMWKLLLRCTLICYVVQVICDFAVGATGALWNPAIPLSALLFAVALLLCTEPLLRHVDTPAIAFGFGIIATALIFLGVLWIERRLVAAPVDLRSATYLVGRVLGCGIAWGIVRQL